jgi:hypothetical protein
MTAMTLSDFGDVLKIGKWDFQVLSISCVTATVV